MAKLKEIYRCSICGNIVEVLNEGAGQLVCCGKPMDLQVEKINEQGNEKHLPVVKITKNSVEVKIGSIEHPMEDNHYIQWVELINGDEINKVFLKPGAKPIAKFKVKDATSVQVRSYCNQHELWSFQKID